MSPGLDPKVNDGPDPRGPKQMSVVQVESSFGLDHLRVSKRRLPSKPEEGEILLRMHAASLNARDTLTVKGVYNPKQPLPLIPCSDGFGEVVSVGTDVERVVPGDRVVPCFAQGWITGRFFANFKNVTLGGPLTGTLAQYMRLAESGVVRAPSHLTAVEAATLPCAGLTAWNAIHEQGQVNAGDVVLVQGTGGVALFALLFAVAFGARVVVTSKSEEKLARVRELGAAHTINYLDSPQWSREVKEITHGLGADHVIELGGSSTLRQSVRAVKAGGCISLIGVLGGPVAELDLPLVVMRNVRLQGVTVGSREAFERMITFIEARQIHPIIDRVFPFSQAAEAFRYVDEARHFGKVCIEID